MTRHMSHMSVSGGRSLQQIRRVAWTRGRVAHGC